MISRLFLLSSVLMLSACVKPDLHLETQKVTVKTPGAKNAKCHLHNDEYKYVAYTDQTITMTRTSEDMDVMCKAEGNRTKTIVVSPDLYQITPDTNKIPEVIIVDFTGVKSKPHDLPDYHYAGQYPLPTEEEYYGPTTVDGQSEPFQEDQALQKRTFQSSNPFANASSRTSYDPREEDK